MYLDDRLILAQDFQIGQAAGPNGAAFLAGAITGDAGGSANTGPMLDLTTRAELFTSALEGFVLEITVTQAFTAGGGTSPAVLFGISVANAASGLTNPYTPVLSGGDSTSLGVFAPQLALGRKMYLPAPVLSQPTLLADAGFANLNGVPRAAWQFMFLTAWQPTATGHWFATGKVSARFIRHRSNILPNRHPDALSAPV